MAKKHEPKPPGQWTTLEEMLLVFAIKRHGSKNWDAIAKELHSRVAMQRNYVSSSVITPKICRDEFLRLRRRFAAEDAEVEEEVCLAPMLDELRRIRVEELRREVKRHDVSIVLLESKIKRLEEERERSLTEETDLRERASERGETKASPATLAGKHSASDKSNGRSSDGVIPTDQKTELATTSRDAENDAVKERKLASKREPEGETGTNPVRWGTEPDRDRGSSSRLIRNAGNGENKRDGGEAAMAATRAGRVGESNELNDSVSESKREAAASKQSSDVQSSATLSRKRRRTSGVATSSDEEGVEIEEVSPVAARKVAAAMKPPESMVDLLRRIRSHRLGSAFERRLRIQESERYRKLVRQHMDLRTIKSRLDRGAYSEDSRKFFRDLLLLFNNAIVFYRRTSSEYVAAVELRALVMKEMKVRLRNRPRERITSSKQKTSKPVIAACGKRGSANPMAPGRTRVKDNEQKKTESKDVNRGNGSLIDGGKGKKERSSSNNQSNNKKGSNNGEKIKKHEFGNNELSSHDAPVIKSVTKRKEKKQQGAANFLRRMKQVSPTESDEEEEEEDGGDVVGREVEKEVKGMKKKGVLTRSTSSMGKRVKEENMKGKTKTGKTVRAVAVAATATVETTGKRERENNGEGNGGRVKKRARR